MSTTVEEEIEMSSFESELAQAILGELEYRGFYDCGKYLDDGLIERIRPIIQKELSNLLTSQKNEIREKINEMSWLKNDDGVTEIEKGVLYVPVADILALLTDKEV